MYGIFWVVVRDYYGSDHTIKVRHIGGFGTPDLNAERARLKSVIEDSTLGYVISSGWGWEEYHPAATIGPLASNKMVVKIGYTDTNGRDGSLELPSPNLDHVDFIAGDLVDLESEAISPLVSQIETYHSDIVSGYPLTVEYAILIGKE